ncbi:MAG: hypothetical protein LBC71_04315, partial [Oscillospiraceae bacterium]|nr:hypothetical protein [Oscillospiraceae bacterium]
FGHAIAVEYSNLLVPDDENDYKAIVENAYVHSRKRESHVEPILKVVRKARLPSVDESERISSKDFFSLSKKISNYYSNYKYENSLLLLIGSVGSGKSTFIRYLQNVSIPKHKDLGCFFWCIANMNNAPISSDKIYFWIVEEYVKRITHSFRDCDFSDKEFLNNLYHKKIEEFKKGVGSYLTDENEFNIQLFHLINKCKEDMNFTLSCLIEYVDVKHGMSFVFVFDNVDQGSNKDQLLMFQVAEWFRNKFNRLVLMSLRDTTYNEYRTAPPLDTVIKNLVFRIDPPNLLAVLHERLKYICRVEKQETSFIGHYTIENGMKVILRENEYLDYFKCILHSIRQDSLVRNIFYCITGRDIRSGIELFIEFCKSGHLLDSDFFAIRATDGQYKVPHYRMMEAVLRGTRLFYSSTSSKIKNMFSSDFMDDWVDPFIRVDMVKWLNDKRDAPGDSGTKGYFTVESLRDSMRILGHDEDTLNRELDNMIKERLILSGSLDDVIEGSNIIRITPYGSLHISLLGNISYLSACSEDVLYRDLSVAQRISDRISEKIGEGHLSVTTKLANVEDMLLYLEKYRDSYVSKPQYVIRNPDNFVFDLSPCFKILEKMKAKWQDEYNGLG